MTGYNKMTDEIMTIDEFVKVHKHVYYCEIIIMPNGDVSYAVPSHIDRMLQILGLTTMDARDVIPSDELPIRWLMEKTGAMPVWYSGVKVPSIVTEGQAKSLIKLIDNKIIELGIMTDLCYTEEELKNDIEKLRIAFEAIEK